MTNSKALLNELSNLANIVDKQTGNAMYSSLKHTRSCLVALSITVTMNAFYMKDQTISHSGLKVNARPLLRPVVTKNGTTKYAKE